MHQYQFTVKGRKMTLTGDENGIARLNLNEIDEKILAPQPPASLLALFYDAEIQLNEYFEGKRFSFSLKLNPSGTEFQKRVWNTLLEIPFGKIRSYKEVATRIGNPNAARAVGLANNRNPLPIIIPCHRVIGLNKKLVGYALGLELKQELIDMERIQAALHTMAAHFGPLPWWPAKNPFEMMVGAILTQNTNWTNVKKALNNFGEQLSPQFIQNIGTIDLAAIIRPSGYHNQKAIKLKALCNWFEKYSFDIEKARKISGELLRKELLEIHGVGPETADSILVYALRKPFFVVDAYTRRIFYRLGINLPKDYEDVRKMMEYYIPREIKTYDYYHGLIVEHAKAFCTKNPKCDLCPLSSICEKRMEATQLKLAF